MKGNFSHFLVCYCQAFLGAGAAALGLIITAPFSSIEGPSISLPSISLPSGGSRPAVEKVVKKADPIKAAKMKGPKGYNLDVTSDARRAPTKAEREAARAEAKAAAKAAKEEGKENTECVHDIPAFRNTVYSNLTTHHVFHSRQS